MFWTLTNMTEEQILKEHAKLIKAQVETLTAINFYHDCRTQIWTQLNTMAEEILSSESARSVKDLSKEKASALDFRLQEYVFRQKAASELTTIIERMTAKSERKLNEIEKKLDAFCKRHGIENFTAEKDTIG